jgi:hypothetical protein
MLDRSRAPGSSLSERRRPYSPHGCCTLQLQFAPAKNAVVASVQKVSFAWPAENTQHWGLFGSGQSVGSWQRSTWVVPPQVVWILVGQPAWVEQAVPSAVAVQLGKLPPEAVTSVPQQTGVCGVFPHSSGPSQPTLSPAGQPAGSTQAYVPAGRVTQQTWLSKQGAPVVPQLKSHFAPPEDEPDEDPDVPDDEPEPDPPLEEDEATPEDEPEDDPELLPEEDPPEDEPEDDEPSWSPASVKPKGSVSPLEQPRATTTTVETASREYFM